jgi:hypothetical protein
LFQYTSRYTCTQWVQVREISHTARTITNQGIVIVFDPKRGLGSEECYEMLQFTKRDCIVYSIGQWTRYMYKSRRGAKGLSRQRIINNLKNGKSDTYRRTLISNIKCMHGYNIM